MKYLWVVLYAIVLLGVVLLIAPYAKSETIETDIGSVAIQRFYPSEFQEFVTECYENNGVLELILKWTPDENGVYRRDANGTIMCDCFISARYLEDDTLEASKCFMFIPEGSGMSTVGQ